MEKYLMIPADELAAFMNKGWPGVDWYLTEHAEYRWETTFTEGTRAELYRPRQPGTMINLVDYDGRVRWQGNRPDPTRGCGYKLSTLFRRWKRICKDSLIVASVPYEKLPTVTATLENAGCLIVYTPTDPAG